MSATIEIFADSSPESRRVVDEVKALACSKCEVIVYNMNEGSSTAGGQDKAGAYGITALPAVTINGRIIDVERLTRAKSALLD
ncbi:glutaredoxin [Paenibacillus mendelii]|uniref:Glutaredoxin n=1 Tax=Paenibacillus mendelii TaxID=206163 RepID=A0ABV6J583_9BACL|nr:glutaredoxin [Paenibacillus mendelii]MCQ6560253.1 glutaredoxin [Paenibacillus mendelii]